MILFDRHGIHSPETLSACSLPYLASGCRLRCCYSRAAFRLKPVSAFRPAQAEADQAEQNLGLRVGEFAHLVVQLCFERLTTNSGCTPRPLRNSKRRLTFIRWHLGYTEENQSLLQFSRFYLRLLLRSYGT